MSIARVYTSEKSRKVWMCGACRTQLPVGSRVHSFAVGFRGTEQKRCDKSGCYPSMAERESSMVADVYAEIEGADVNGAESLSDLESIRDAIVDACNNVADEYESNSMYDVNPDLQERAETLRSTADELEGWQPEGDEPDADGEDCEDCEGTGEVVTGDPGDPDKCEQCDGSGKVVDEDAINDWLETAKASLQEAIDGMELP